MSEFYTAPGTWYKGNLHMHTTESDGKLAPADAAAWYRSRGYDFIAMTDHRKTIDPQSYNTEGFLALHGMELDCVDPDRDIGYHIVAVGIEQPFSQDEATRKGPAQPLVDAILQHGGLPIMAHPYWLGQESSDIACVRGPSLVEVYNATCARPGKAYGNVHWDGLLDRGHHYFAAATDDAHHYDDDAGKGWVMVKAAELTRDAIVAALRQGAFYSSQGPTITDFRVEGNEAHVETSEVAEIAFISNRGRGRVISAPDGETITSATCSLWKGGYVRAEVRDADGKRAWSQPIFYG